MKAEMKTEPKERPIIFSGEMVRAILDGRKTMTRRVVKPQPDTDYVSDFCEWGGIYVGQYIGDMNPACIQCPYGKPGDRLWVRETWWTYPKSITPRLMRDGADTWNFIDGFPIEYDVDVQGSHVDVLEHLEWVRRPSIFLRREHSRITLEIVKVRVERLQDISDEDVNAEGLLPIEGNCGFSFDLKTGEPIERSICQCCETPKYRFEQLWDSINGKPKYVKGAGYGGETKKIDSPVIWEKNPWVWVIEFKKL